jgi:hypothetical protein
MWEHPRLTSGVHDCEAYRTRKGLGVAPFDRQLSVRAPLTQSLGGVRTGLCLLRDVSNQPLLNFPKFLLTPVPARSRIRRNRLSEEQFPNSERNTP